jgi:hypothetical protein
MASQAAGDSATDPSPLPPLAFRLVLMAAAAKIAFHVATATVWGLHRDEFYYLAGGRHLAWGYVDHPPHTPVLYRLSDLLFGDSQLGLHIVPALAGGGLVVLGALLARELGGGRTAQAVTMLVAGLGPVYLTPVHFLGTVTIDLVAWAAATLLVLRLVRTGDVRLWLAVGPIVGIGLLNKHSMLFWVGAVGAALLAAPQRRLLVTPWLVAGALIAALMFFPNLVWQARHDWATLTFLRDLRERTMAENLAQFVPLQLALVTMAGTVLWLVALRHLFRNPSWRPYRWLGIAYVVLFVALFASGGKGYYLGSIYLPLVAVGAVIVERAWTHAARRKLVVAIVMTGAIGAPIATPMLPVRALRTLPILDLNADLGGMLGWHDAARQIAGVYRSLPPDQQRDGVILTANYSQAGAVDYWHQELGVPHAISGHNSYWWWGYHDAGADATVVAVGFSLGYLARFFADCRQVSEIRDPDDLIDSELEGVRIDVCRATQPWSAIWPQLRHYG